MSLRGLFAFQQQASSRLSSTRALLVFGRNGRLQKPHPCCYSYISPPPRVSPVLVCRSLTTKSGSNTSSSSSSSSTPKEAAVETEAVISSKKPKEVNEKSSDEPPTSSSSSSSSTSPSPSPSPTAETSTSAFPALPSWLENALEVWKTQSGTAEVMALKEDVSAKSYAFDTASVRLTNARRGLDGSMLLWERTNANHLQLLQRRDSWTAEDAQQFATLIGKEVHFRTTMEAARTELTASENHLSHCQLEYMNAMRKRYHEEQIWQDQWRVLGTYGTWSLIGLNMCVFLASQFFHYRREARKLKHLETLVKENVASQEAFKDSMVAERQAFAEGTTGTPPTTTTARGTTSANSTDDDSSSATANDKNDVAAESKPENETTTTAAATAEPPKPLPEWLETFLNETKWVKSITSSKVVQTTVEKSKAFYSSTKTKTRKVYTSAKAQTDEFLQTVHLPSAILGASVTGVAVVATLLLSSHSSSNSGR